MTALARVQPSRPNSIGELFECYGQLYRWLALTTLGVGTFAVLLVSTIINVAIPSIMGAFGVNQSEAQWLSTGFLASATISMLMSSWCLNRFGVRNTLVYPTLLFTSSSLLAAMSPTIDILISARILQGFSYGFFLPLATYMAARIFPAEKQGLAMGLFGLIAVMGPAIGPYLGGIAVDTLGWRSVFLIPLPMTLISLPMALRYLPGRDLSIDAGRFDWKGLFWLTLAIVSLLVGLSNSLKYGWNSDFLLFCWSVALVTTVLFLARQRRISAPLMDLTLFRDRNYVLSAIISALLGSALFGVMYVVPLFMQVVQELTPTQAGLALLPAGAILVLAFPVSGYCSDRLPSHWLIITGMLLLAYSITLMMDVDRFTALPTICWWLVLGRLGMAMSRPALYRTAFITLHPAQLAQASGSINFIRQLGGAFGVNLTSMFLERSTNQNMDYIVSLQTANNAQLEAAMSELIPELHQAGIAPAFQESLAGYVIGNEFYRQAMTMGFQDTFFVTGVVMLIAIIPGYMLRTPKT